MSLHSSGFCQAAAECKGKVFRGDILIYREVRLKREVVVFVSTSPLQSLYVSANVVAARRKILQYKVLKASRK